jgi:hypothetical protein
VFLHLVRKPGDDSLELEPDAAGTLAWRGEAKAVTIFRKSTAAAAKITIVSGLRRRRLAMRQAVGVAAAHVLAHSPNDLENEAVRGSQPVLNMVASVPNLTFHVKFYDLGLYSPNRSDYIIQRFNLSQADLIYAYFAPFSSEKLLHAFPVRIHID